MRFPFFSLTEIPHNLKSKAHNSPKTREASTLHRSSDGPQRCGHALLRIISGGSPVNDLINSLWSDDRGQDIAEYAVMLAVILVIVVGTIRLIGSNANNVFSAAASSIQ